MEYYSTLKKEVNPAICDNIHELGGHYAKLKKPATQGQILHDSFTMGYIT